MSKYSRYYNTRQTMYRDMAARWVKWAETANITESDRSGIALFFKDIAVRFGLIKEFREIGVI